MPAIFTTPEEITDLLYEGELEPDTLLGGRIAPPGAAHRPAVALGRPVSLGQFGVDLAIPAGAEALLREHDCYLLRLACSFRPPADGVLTFASLSAYLRPRVGGAPVIARDLFPQQVYEFYEGEIVAGVGPGLSLQMLDAALEMPATSREGLIALRRILVERFDREELRTLCFDLSVDYDSLPGASTAGKARELVAYLERRRRIPDLVAVGRRLRPDVPWDEVSGTAPSPSWLSGLGGVETLIRYHCLEPVILALGVQRSDPGWEFNPHPKHPLRGNKYLYLVVQKPRPVEAVRMTLRVAVEMETEGGPFSATVRREDQERLSVVMWGG